MTKIFVTGGAGFIGSHVVDKFLEAGHWVAVVDDFSTGRRENLNPRAKFYEVSITDRQKLAEVFEKEKPEIVCHQAAQVSVRNSVADPVFDAQNNIIGTINLLQSACQHGIKKFIFASTGGAIYGDTDKVPTPEEHPERPVCPYGISKLAAEKYIQFYGQQFKLPCVILRYANVYGPRQDPHGEAGVVAIFAGNLFHDRECVINGDGKQTRDFVYVGDVAAANLKALEYSGCHSEAANRHPELTNRHSEFSSESKGKILKQVQDDAIALVQDDAIASVQDDRQAVVFNIGTGKQTDINTLYQIMAEAYRELSGKDLLPAQHGPAKPGEQKRSCVDISRAQKELGWKPKMGLGEGLEKTLKFFNNQ